QRLAKPSTRRGQPEPQFDVPFLPSQENPKPVVRAAARQPCTRKGALLHRSKCARALLEESCRIEHDRHRIRTLLSGNSEHPDYLLGGPKLLKMTGKHNIALRVIGLCKQEPVAIGRDR